MWFGFAVRHVGKKLMVGAAVLGGAVLATESGRKFAKVIAASVKGAGEAAVEEIKAQRQTEKPPTITSDGL